MRGSRRVALLARVLQSTLRCGLVGATRHRHAACAAAPFGVPLDPALGRVAANSMDDTAMDTSPGPMPPKGGKGVSFLNVHVPNKQASVGEESSAETQRERERDCRRDPRCMGAYIIR